MHCKDITEKLDDYMDGGLDLAMAEAISSHAESCDTCRTVIESERELRGSLKDYPMPQAQAGFYDQALVHAAHKGNRRQRDRWLLTGFGSAVAAGARCLAGFRLVAEYAADTRRWRFDTGRDNRPRRDAHGQPRVCICNSTGHCNADHITARRH